MKNIIVYGAGYVGLSNAAVISKSHNVALIDINKNIIENLKIGKVHIDDNEMKARIAEFKNLNFYTTEPKGDPDLVILALPTNYDEEKNFFDTSLLDEQIKKIRTYSNVPILIKSTIPVGYTSIMNLKHGNVIFSPEFLREGSSLRDAENPTRIILGTESNYDWVLEILSSGINNKPESIVMSPTEAETVKLFSNTYLAMRVAFVNELDSFANFKNLNSDNIIKGVSLDPRIGSQYFSPSSGYGGYCLPKDSKQLLKEFEKLGMPNDLLEGIVRSNSNRKNNIVRHAIENKISEVTIHGIGHKPGVTNYRNSQNLLLAKEYLKKGIKVRIIDKNFSKKEIEGFKIE